MSVVQRTPNLGIGIRLTRAEGVADQADSPTPSDSDCRVDRLRWAGLYMPDDSVWSPTWVAVSVPSAGLGDHSHPDITFLSVWHPVIYPHASYPQDAVVMLGVPFGERVCPVRWSWSWDGLPPPDSDVTQTGPLLVVTLIPVAESLLPTGYERTLTAVARCGETEIGSLKLLVHHGT